MVRICDGADERHALRHLHPACRARGGRRRAAGAADAPATSSPRRRAPAASTCRSDEAELAAPPRGAGAAAPRYERSFAALYQSHVSQAHEGCDFDFLAGTGAVPEPADLLKASIIDITNRFKRSASRDRARRSPLGTWLMSAAPATAEAIGHCGFDFLVVDMEHVPIEVADLPDILRAVGATPAEPVVRLAWNDQVLVKRVLDAGAQTIMLPFVQTAEEARAAVRVAKYPPAGVRGVAAVHRASPLRRGCRLSEARQ